MPLFKNIRQVRNYITISAANNDTAVPPQITTEEEYLIPVLGEDLFDTMQTEADTIPASPSALLTKCFTALAYLVYFKQLPFIHTRITDTGLKNMVTDTQTTAYRYQYENMLDTLEMEGRAALEKLFTYLIDHIEDYASWASSDAYKRLNKNLIKTGTEFATYYHLHQPHRTFYALQPIVQEVEDLYLKPSIGSDFFNYLKDTANPSEDELEVLGLLRKALANLTIHKACAKLSVMVRTEGFTVLLAPHPDSSLNGQNNAPEKQIMQLRQETERDGNNYLNMAKKILNERATSELYAIYFASALYKSPTAITSNLNDTMNGVYAF